MSKPAADAPEHGPATNGDNAMTDNPTGAGHNRLGLLAAEIVEHHRCAGAATREAIRHAVEAGRRLAEAKKLVGHGGWLPWLKENVPGISARTAQRYLAAAERAGKNDTVSFFRLRDLARRPRSKPTLQQEEAAADGATLVSCDEAVRWLQKMGLSALDAHAGVIRYLHLRLVESLVETADMLGAVQERLTPEQWPLWLGTSFGWTVENATVLMEAATAIKAGLPFDEEAVIDVLMAREGLAA